jgi:hypothetical protein
VLPNGNVHPETEHCANGRHAPSTSPREALPAPSSEAVARKLVATARTDPKRAVRIWEQAVKEYGPAATAEQVAAIANGHPAKEPWEDDMVRLASDLRRFARTKDPKDAKRALYRWREAYKVLDKAAQDG